MRWTELFESISETLFARYGGKTMPFSDLPESAQKALDAFIDAEREEYENQSFGYVMLPIKAVRDACWNAPDNEMRDDHKDWNEYHDWYWGAENDADYAGHLADPWPVILCDGEGIVDGWHRLHWYHRNGLKQVPALMFVDQLDEGRKRKRRKSRRWPAWYGCHGPIGHDGNGGDAGDGGGDGGAP